MIVVQKIKIQDAKRKPNVNVIIYNIYGAG